MGVLALTKSNFNEEVINSDKPVLIDFWAEWCAPCKMLSPIVDEFAEGTADVKVCKVNVDQEPELAGQFGIMSIPTLILMKDGKIANKSIGLINKAEIQRMVSE